MRSLTLVIMAAGNSTRFCNASPYIDNSQFAKTMHNSSFPVSMFHNQSQKQSVKKQWLRLGHIPLWSFVTQSLAHQILTCLQELNSCVQEKSSQNISQCFIEKIIITASSNDIAYMKKLIANTLEFTLHDSQKQDTIQIPLQIIEGGNSRYLSLKNALDQIESDYVIVNDCARFYTDNNVLKNMLTLLMQNNYDCIAPYLPVTDTTLLYDEDTKCHNVIERNNLKLLQTPQISKTKKLKQAFLLETEFSDESSAICALKTQNIKLVEGSKNMLKLTYKEDLYQLKKFFNANRHLHNHHTPLVGHGSDIHAFEESKPMWLCGVKIESNFGFKAHSDGDVGIHALIDAILGAMNYGDIGERFPDTNAEFKNIDSKILLKEVYDYCLSTGLEIINIDITILAQTPRITPYKHTMQEALAKILYLDKSQISIKASTAEHLGFIGRKEGVFVQSVVQLKTRLL